MRKNSVIDCSGGELGTNQPKTKPFRMPRQGKGVHVRSPRSAFAGWHETGGAEFRFQQAQVFPKLLGFSQHTDNQPAWGEAKHGGKPAPATAQRADGTTRLHGTDNVAHGFLHGKHPKETFGMGKQGRLNKARTQINDANLLCTTDGSVLTQRFKIVRLKRLGGRISRRRTKTAVGSKGGDGCQSATALTQKTTECPIHAGCPTGDVCGEHR